MSIRDITATVKLASQMTPDDVLKFSAWMWANRGKTHFDPDVMNQPRMCVTSADDERGPLLYLPLRPVLMFDCLAPRPDASRREIALGLWQIGEVTKSIMAQTGHRDAFAHITDNDEANSLAKHGWTEITGIRLMRLRIPAEVPHE